MREITISGKPYKINVSWGKMRKVNLKHMNGGESVQGGPEYLIDSIWSYLVPRFLFIKPFMFKRRMINAISPRELRDADKILAEEITLEDREGKN